MGDCNHCAHERALSVEDDITVVFHKVDTHGTNSGDDHDDVCGGGDDDERTAERIHLQNNCRVACDYGDDAEEEARGSEDSPEGSERKTLCPPTFCVGSEPVSREESAREGRGAHAL